MRVRELIEQKGRPEVITITPAADIATAAQRLMQHTIGGLPVVENERLVGFLAERDIVRSVHLHVGGVRDLKVRDTMRSPAPTCSIDDPVRMVAARMNTERLRHLVVLDGAEIAGVLSIGDIVRRRVEELEVEAGVLRDYVVAQRAKG